MTALDTHLDREQHRCVEKLLAFVASPSVLAIPANTPDVMRAVSWVALFGFSRDDEILHAPSEFFRLDVFRKGQTAYGRRLKRLGA